MPLLVNSVPNLIQGVSQQSDSLRNPSQCDEQINAFSSVVDGLIKRQGTEFVGKIEFPTSPALDENGDEIFDEYGNQIFAADTSSSDSLFTHFVKRDEDNKYCVMVSLGNGTPTVGVINLSIGTSIPVATTSIAGSYLSGITNPLADIRALTVADYTFLVNRNRTIQKIEAAEQKSDIPADEALIVVKLGDYEKSYSIYVDDKLVEPATSLENQHIYTDQYWTNHTGTIVPSTYMSGPASGTNNTDRAGVYADTEHIAEDLKSSIDEHVVNTNSGVSSITINATPAALGDGWLGGRSTGVYEKSRYTGQYQLNGEYRRELKLEAFITQAGAATASAELVVTKGVITSARNIKRGNNFNPSNPVFISYRVSERNWRFDWYKNGNRWEGWYAITDQTNPHYYIPPATFNSSTNANTDPVQITTQVFTDGGFEVERKGSVIKLTSTEGPFNVRVEDGLGGQALGVVYREVNSITELPVECYNGFGPVKVMGDADIDQDDYYVRFSTKDKEEFGEGSWLETVGYFQDESQTSSLEGIDTLLASGTMPVTLVPYFNGTTITDFRLSSPNSLLYVENDNNYYRLDKNHRAAAANEPGAGTDWEEYWTEVDETVDTEASVGYLVWREGTFYYGPNNEYRFGTWSARSAGDDKTNPFPSFVGKTINDVFFFKNRLGFLTDSNVIFSEADEYYNFFRTTTQQLLDSAPIDVGLSHTKVAKLQYAKAFQEKLMLFSDTSQFVLRGQDVLSPKTVAISPVSEYDVSDQVEPLALGNYIYFPFKRDNYEGMYEYFVDNNTEVFTAQEITEQAPRYIRSNVQMMAGSTTQNVICLKSDRYSERYTLYVYKYFWSNNEKVQSAWQKFEFRHCTNICGFEFIDSTLYMLNHVGARLQLEKLSFEDGRTEAIHGFHSFRGDLGYPILLDSKIAQGTTAYTTRSYDPLTNKTTISNLPISPSDDLQLWTMHGAKYDITRVDATSFTVDGPIYDYVSYDNVIYKCNLSHNSGFYIETPLDPDRLKPGGYSYINEEGDIVIVPSPLWTELSGDEAVIVTSAPEWQLDRWYQGPYEFVIGYAYNMLYRFSKQTLKQPTERGGRTKSDYTFQTIRTGSLEYADSGAMQVEVYPKFRDPKAYPFNPTNLGSDSIINKFTPESGHFRFPVQTQSEELRLEVKSSSALPLRLLAAEFESMVVSRSKRYGA